MPRWVRKVFIQFLPRVLLMRRPTHRKEEESAILDRFGYQNDHYHPPGRRHSPHQQQLQQTSSYSAMLVREDMSSPDLNHLRRRAYSSDVQRAIDGIRFIADHIRETDAFGNVSSWQANSTAKWLSVNAMIAEIVSFFEGKLFFGVLHCDFLYSCLNP